MSQPPDKLSHLRNVIISQVFVSKDDEFIVDAHGNDEKWLFDFRRVMLQSENLSSYAEAFIEKHKDIYPYQVGGLEVAAIPLITAIIMKSEELGKPVTGFFIRKSRKKSGLMKMVEGKISDKPIILVDDILNSGSTFLRQLEVLDGLRQEGQVTSRVVAISSILQFRDAQEYAFLAERNIDIRSFFQLKDLAEDLEGKGFSMPVAQQIPRYNAYDILWSRKFNDPNYWLVEPKGEVVLNDGRLYVGTDSKVLYCLDAVSGKELFSHPLGRGREKGRVFSPLCVAGESLVFGAYDKNIHSLSLSEGKKNWIFFDYDHTGGAIGYAANAGILCAHVTSGVFKKKSVVVGIDSSKGKRVWEVGIDDSSYGNVICSPYVDCFIVTTDTGNVYSLRTSDGKIMWLMKTGIPCNMPAVSPSGIIIVGSRNGAPDSDMAQVSFIDASGNLLFRFEDDLLISYSTPYIAEDVAYLGALNKKVYAFSLTEKKLIWSKDLGARIFSSPTMTTTCDGKKVLCVGTNGGQFIELDPHTGDIISRTFFSERITDPSVHDDATGITFLTTYANELYALKRKEDK